MRSRTALLIYGGYPVAVREKARCRLAKPRGQGQTACRIGPFGAPSSRAARARASAFELSGQEGRSAGRGEANAEILGCLSSSLERKGAAPAPMQHRGGSTARTSVHAASEAAAPKGGLASAPRRSSRATASSRSPPPSPCARHSGRRRASSCSRGLPRAAGASMEEPMRSQARAGACSARSAFGRHSKTTHSRCGRSSSPIAGSTMCLARPSFHSRTNQEMTRQATAKPSPIWSKRKRCAEPLSKLPTPRRSRPFRTGSMRSRLKAAAAWPS